MLKIGSAVHTAHGPGTITEMETTRGRTQCKVAGNGFDVWVDEVKIAALGDVDESNSTTLPYDYTPQHPSEMYTQDSTMTPDHDVDLGDRLTPTDSVSGESAQARAYPAPNPDLFATAASLRSAAPGSMRHYMQWANQAGLQPGQAEAADLYASTHGLDSGHAGQLMENFNNQGQRTAHIRQAYAAYRPAGLSDKYIDVYSSAPVNPLLEDPVGTIQRAAHRDIVAHGLDPRVAEYMDLIEADPMVREAAWKDVRAKAMRLKREGAVHVKVAAPNRIRAVVNGDNGIYDVLVIKEGNSNSISQWYCGCAWGRWAFKRKYSYVGRLCFLPGTKVTMADGTLRAIEEVQAGDLVRSHTGEARKVTSLVVNHHDDVVYGIHPRGHETVWATGEHPFYVRPHTDIKCQDCWDKGYQRSQCTAQGTKGHDHKNGAGEKFNPAWVEAKDLTTDYWMSKTAPKIAERDVVFDLTEFCENYREDDQGRILRGKPTPQTGMRYRGTPVNRHVKLDDDLAYLFGLYLGDGSHPRRGTVGFHFGLDEQHLVDEVTRIAGEKFGLTPQVHVARSGRNIIDVLLTSAIVTEFFHRYLGTGHAVKKLSPEILEAPARVLSHVLRGWIDSDDASSVNRNLVFQMEQIALRNGISSSVTVTPASKQANGLVGTNTRDIYHLNCSPGRDQKSQFFTNFVEDDTAWVRIQDVSTKHYHGPVFNLSVEVDETYQVNGFNTHNCSHAYASYLSMGKREKGDGQQYPTKLRRTYPYYTGEPKPSGHLTLKRKRRKSSLLDDYKDWSREENSGNVDVPSADDFLSQRDETPTPAEAKAVYDYACENASERPARNYDVSGYSFDPAKVWESTETADDNALLRAEAPPFRLTPDLYLVAEGEGQHFTDVESDDRTTTGPDQITAKVDKSWAKKHGDLDDEHDPIVRFSARRMALTYTADENLLQRLRDLSAETNAENAGHMREHNREISEVISELHERGYDANRLVASMRRTADEDEVNNYSPLSFGLDKEQLATPAVDTGRVPNLLRDLTGAPGEQTTNKVPGLLQNLKGFDAGADNQNGWQVGGDSKALSGDGVTGGGGSPSATNVSSSGGGGNGGGGSGWSPNSNTDPIGPGEYTIQSGDTYSNLAERAGWGEDYQGFANATGYHADNPDLIFAGDTINVPGKPGSEPAPAADPAAPGTPPPPAPGAPAPADSTSGAPAPDPGVNTGFAPPPTPAPAAEVAPPNPAVAAPGATLTGDQLTNPGLTAARSRRRFLADEDERNHDDDSLLGNAGSASQGIGGGPAAVAADSATPPAAAAPPTSTTPAGSVVTSPRGVKDPGPGPEQMTTPNFNQRTGPQEPVPSDGSKKVLEDQPPQGAASTGGGNNMDMSQIIPALSGVAGAVMPMISPAVNGLAQGIGGGIGDAMSGVGQAIGSGLSGLLSFASYDPRNDPGDDADPTFAGTGPERKYWYSPSEDWVDDHERGDFLDLNDEPEGDLITYRKQQPRQASLRDEDDSDIVAAFQRNAAHSALATSPGGTFSDDAIANAARGFLRTAGRVYSLAEQQELMDEHHPKGARNLASLDLSNTHYEDLSWS